MRSRILFIFFFSSFLFGNNYKIVKDGSTNKFIIIGTSTKEAYQDSNFSWWFNAEYTNYDVNTKIIDHYKNNFEGKIIKIVLGSWCSDSRREVPRFVKILDFVNFPFDKVIFINVNRDKVGLSNEVDGLEIRLVPTFIIYENGKELGRIIESPVNSLEGDIIKIIE